jgi:hypothetical protein
MVAKFPYLFTWVPPYIPPQSFDNQLQVFSDYHCTNYNVMDCRFVWPTGNKNFYTDKGPTYVTEFLSIFDKKKFPLNIFLLSFCFYRYIFYIY